MGRKSKYSADFKLMIIHEAETLGITRTSRLYSISDHTIRTWDCFCPAFFKCSECCSTNLFRISLKFTDKRPFLTILSVIAFFGAGHLRTDDPFSSMCP